MVDPIGKETVLYSFTTSPDGAGPDAGLVRDKAGNFYGTTTAALWLRNGIQAGPIRRGDRAA